MTRQMKLIGFLQAQNCSNYPASWRHPSSKANWFSREYYEDIGRTLERGKFQLAFFDDHAECVGIQQLADGLHLRKYQPPFRRFLVDRNDQHG